MDREKVINCLTDLENIMIERKSICPQEELQYWVELQEGIADVIVLLNENEPVVRCKDCIWFHKPDAETKKTCKCSYHGGVTEENRYCWWGEKDA